MVALSRISRLTVLALVTGALACDAPSDTSRKASPAASAKAAKKSPAVELEVKEGPFPEIKLKGSRYNKAKIRLKMATVSKENPEVAGHLELQSWDMPIGTTIGCQGKSFKVEKTALERFYCDLRDHLGKVTVAELAKPLTRVKLDVKLSIALPATRARTWRCLRWR
ncbi:MAG: hypothetical protein DRI90_00250 [Deltaproteobacteria bacterium]|nr:MAG: hypothetical protein DRI90_00250 [Deltaproteobacteria bacterium]